MTLPEKECWLSFVNPETPEIKATHFHDGISWMHARFLEGMLFVSLCSSMQADLDPASRYWPQWRGPLANGVAPSADPPLEWSEKKNIRWKTALPGKAHASPVVWGDSIFLTAAESYGEAQPPVYDQAPGSHDNVGVTQAHHFIALSVRRSDGHVLWRQTLHSEFPKEGGHQTGSLASNSPTTDGERVYFSFGSRGLFCLNFKGETLWKKNLGPMQTLHAHGEGSSPVLYKDFLLVNWDHEGDSFLVALDKTTGEERWRTSRDEKTSWSTPLVLPDLPVPQVVVSATKRVRGYNVRTGELLWECGGLARNVVATPVALGGLVFAANSYDWQAMLAIQADQAHGDITDTDKVVWRLNRLTPYVPSPLILGETLYFLRHNQNVLTALNARTGKAVTESVRVGKLRDIFASPVAAANRIYVVSREGDTVVLDPAPSLRILATNHLDDAFSASPAVVDRELYLRGEKFLYCLATP